MMEDPLLQQMTAANFQDENGKLDVYNPINTN